MIMKFKQIKYCVKYSYRYSVEFTDCIQQLVSIYSNDILVPNNNITLKNIKEILAAIVKINKHMQDPDLSLIANNIEIITINRTI